MARYIDPFEAQINQMTNDMERHLRRDTLWQHQSSMNQALQGQMMAGLGYQGASLAGQSFVPEPLPPAQEDVRMQRPKPYSIKSSSGIRGELQSEVDEWLKDIP